MKRGECETNRNKSNQFHLIVKTFSLVYRVRERERERPIKHGHALRTFVQQGNLLPFPLPNPPSIILTLRYACLQSSSVWQMPSIYLYVTIIFTRKQKNNFIIFFFI